MSVKIRVSILGLFIAALTVLAACSSPKTLLTSTPGTPGLNETAELASPTPDIRTPSPSPSTQILAPTETRVVEQPTETPEPLEKWERVQVRQGYLGRHGSNPLAGFTIELPPGWTFGESPSRNDTASGWIAANSLALERGVPYLEFQIGGRSTFDVELLFEDPDSDLRFPVVEGERATMNLANASTADFSDFGIRVGIYYEKIPGGESAPSLNITGNSRGFIDQEQLARVLTSVRYEPIAELPELLAVEEVSTNGWKRTPARKDFNTFTLLLPPEWSQTDYQLSDTLSGEFGNGDITVRYEFAGLASGPHNPVDRFILGRPGPTQFMWEERLEAGMFTFIKPDSPEPDEDAITGAFIQFAYPVNAVPPVNLPFGLARLNIRSTGLSNEEQATVLAMLRSIELEPGTSKLKE